VRCCVRLEGSRQCCRRVDMIIRDWLRDLLLASSAMRWIWLLFLPVFDEPLVGRNDEISLENDLEI
jgi:hypothetical protein